MKSLVIVLLSLFLIPVNGKAKTLQTTTYNVNGNTYVLYTNKSKKTIDIYIKNKKIVTGLGKDEISAVKITKKNKKLYTTDLKTKESKVTLDYEHYLDHTSIDTTDDSKAVCTFKKNNNKAYHGEVVAVFYDRNRKVIDVKKKNFILKRKKTVGLYSGNPLVKDIKVYKRMYH